jgi:two-component system, chemotaxis family, protein-glutamate methylesterase/glutaminase
MTRPATGRDRLVVVGTSLGGLAALPVVLCGLRADFPAPVVVVQHRSAAAGFSALASVLQRNCSLEVREVFDKDPLVAGRIYLAPSDYHVLIDDDHLALSTEARVQYARPSIDVLFMSAAETHGSRTIAVILTGANRDGVVGARQIKLRGGIILVQDPATAEAPTMPTATLAAVAVDRVLTLAEIPVVLAELTRAPPPR